jgi:hypothetical protein
LQDKTTGEPRLQLCGPPTANEILLFRLQEPEKVRWCMDRLGVEYVEKPAGGTLGAFLLGRSVPVLKFRNERYT